MVDRMFQLSDVTMVRDDRTILSIGQLAVPTDRFSVVLGHNGSGKSTLVGLLSGQQKPDSGRILLHGRDICTFSARELARAVAFLPQKLPPSVGLTVRELVRLGRFPWRGAFGRWNAEDARVIDDALDKTGVARFAHTPADSLSGGERQRAWISMLLAQQSPVVILDEPTSALDVHHQYQVMTLLAELNREHGLGVVVILHDINLALRYATHVIALKQGRVAFEGPVHLLLEERALSALYHSPIRIIDHPAPAADSRTGKVAVVCA